MAPRNPDALDPRRINLDNEARMARNQAAKTAEQVVLRRAQLISGFLELGIDQAEAEERAGQDHRVQGLSAAVDHWTSTAEQAERRIAIIDGETPAATEPPRRVVRKRRAAS